MPALRVVKHRRSANLYVRGTVRGKTVFESTGTDSRALAEEYAAQREAELFRQEIYGHKPSPPFAHAAADYLEAEPRRPDTIRRVAYLCTHFGPVPLKDIDQQAVDRAYRVLLTPKAGNATKLRAVLTPLRAVMEFGAVRGMCSRPAFQTPRQARRQTAFLRPEQATALIEAAPPHLRPLLIFLLGTGARMSEALELEWSSVDLVGARAVLNQKQGDQRHADLPSVVLHALAALPHRTGRVFRKAQTHRQRVRGELADGYRDTGRDGGGGEIKTAWASTCARAGLPGTWQEWSYPSRGGFVQRRFKPEFTPHGLRHTWASWHHCVHRDLLLLKHDGGWHTVSMCERYAKLMPEAYRPAILQWRNGSERAVHLAAIA